MSESTPYSAISLLKQSYTLVTTQKEAFKKLLLAPFLMIALTVWIPVIGSLISLVVFMMAAVPIGRFILVQEEPSSWKDIVSWSPRHTAFLRSLSLWFLILGGAGLGAAAIGQLIFWITSSSPLAIGIGVLLGAVSVLYLGVRLTFMPILSIMDQTDVFRRSWHMTSKHGWFIFRISSCYLLLWCANDAIFYGINTLIFSIMSWFGIIFVSPLRGISEVFNILLMTVPYALVYRALQQEVPPTEALNEGLEELPLLSSQP